MIGFGAGIVVSVSGSFHGMKGKPHFIWVKSLSSYLFPWNYSNRYSGEVYTKTRND